MPDHGFERTERRRERTAGNLDRRLLAADVQAARQVLRAERHLQRMPGVVDGDQRRRRLRALERGAEVLFGRLRDNLDRLRRRKKDVLRLHDLPRQQLRPEAQVVGRRIHRDAAIEEQPLHVRDD